MAMMVEQELDAREQEQQHKEHDDHHQEPVQQDEEEHQAADPPAPSSDPPPPSSDPPLSRTESVLSLLCSDPSDRSASVRSGWTGCSSFSSRGGGGGGGGEGALIGDLLEGVTVAGKGRGRPKNRLFRPFVPVNPGSAEGAGASGAGAEGADEEVPSPPKKRPRGRPPLHAGTSHFNRDGAHPNPSHWLPLTRPSGYVPPVGPIVPDDPSVVTIVHTGRLVKRPVAFDPAVRPQVGLAQSILWRGAMSPQTISVTKPARGDVLLKGTTFEVEYSCPVPCPPGNVHIVLVRAQRRVDCIYQLLYAGDAKRASGPERLRTDWTVLCEVPRDAVAGVEYYVEIVAVHPPQRVDLPPCSGRTGGFLSVLSDGASQDDYSDVGMWCACGCRVYRSNSVVKGLFVQCDSCHTWHHSDCVGYREERRRNSNLPWECPFCESLAQPEPDLGLSLQMLGMIRDSMCSYSRVAGPNYGPEAFCCTPAHVRPFLRQVLQPFAGLRCTDWGAGTGSLSQTLPPGSLCVEKDEQRYQAGLSEVPSMTWLRDDVLSEAFVGRAVRGEGGRFDLILSNPDFEVAMAFLFVALLYLNHRANPASRIVFLLPSDFFEGSPSRARGYKILGLRIEKEYRLGHLAYLSTTDRGKKTVDSLFVFAVGRNDKFEHITVNARTAGLIAPPPKPIWAEGEVEALERDDDGSDADPSDPGHPAAAPRETDEERLKREKLERRLKRLKAKEYTGPKRPRGRPPKEKRVETQPEADDKGGADNNDNNDTEDEEEEEAGDEEEDEDDGLTIEF